MKLYQLVPLEVQADSAKIWVGTWWPSFALDLLPFRLRLRIDQHGPGQGQAAYNGLVTTHAELPEDDDWQPCLPHHDASGRFHVIELRNLVPGHEYDVQLEMEFADGWRAVEGVDATFDSLPLELPRTGKGHFGVAFGSCFYEKNDAGRAALAFKKLHESADARPHIKLLLGDQVYLDLDLPRFMPRTLSTQQIRELVIRRYRQNWLTLGSLLERGGTWFLIDDHEIWDDYPYTGTLNAVAPILNIDPRMRGTWEKACRNAAQSIQQADGGFRHISVGNLSIGVLDVRFGRTQERFVHPDVLNVVKAWLAAAKGPTILAMQQLLFRPRLDHALFGIRAGHQLASFGKQYGELAEAIIGAPHDVVVLTGDVHFGRIAQVQVPRGDGHHKIIEIVSSPLSNLTGINGLSTAPPDTVPEYFPTGDDAPQKFQVHYERAISRRSQNASREHFVTVHFSAELNDAVLMKVKAWQVRTNADSDELPAVDYEWESRLT